MHASSHVPAYLPNVQVPTSCDDRTAESTFTSAHQMNTVISTRTSSTAFGRRSRPGNCQRHHQLSLIRIIDSFVYFPPDVIFAARRRCRLWRFREVLQGRFRSNVVVVVVISQGKGTVRPEQIIAWLIL